MAKYALYVSLKAKPGKEKDVEAFLKQGAEMAKKEAGTVNWYGLKEDEGNYSVFDTFNDEAGRDAHLNGEIAKGLSHLNALVGRFGNVAGADLGGDARSETGGSSIRR